jgi:hypothetical protein
MPKANIRRPDGSTITIEGTASEIAALVHKIEGKTPTTSKESQTPKRRQSTVRPSIPDLLMTLHVEGFFKQPKELAEIKQALAEQGHIYGVTSIAPALLRLVKRKEIRRVKKDKRWFYTG